MNEIEKLYKNAGIPKFGKRQCRDSEYLECQNYCFCNVDNKCDKFIIDYPPFTAEKQLELVKWLLNTINLLCLSPLKNSEDFENDLAGLINCLWQDLTSEEQIEIKEILE